MLQNGLLDTTPPILVANPWAAGAGNSKLPYYDASGVAQTADISTSASVYLDTGTNQLRVRSLHGDSNLGNLGLLYQSCNWPTAATALTATVGPIGRQDSASLSVGGTSVATYVWPAQSSCILDVVCSFTNGAIGLQISKRYFVYKTAAGVLTCTQLGTAIPDGTAMTGADVALSVSGASLVRTITAPATASNVYCEVSGSMLLGKT